MEKHFQRLKNNQKDRQMVQYIQQAKRADWLSPQKQFDWALHVMGKIDLDPGANREQVYKPPHMFFGESAEDDGMTQAWHTIGDGKVYINPTWSSRPPKEGEMPFFHPIKEWVQKMHEEAKLGASVFFVGPANTGSQWFFNHVGQSSAFCLLKRRIKFRLPGMDPEAKSQPGRDNVAALWTKDAAELERFGALMTHEGLVTEMGVIA